MLWLFGFVLANNYCYPLEHHQSLLKQWKRLSAKVYLQNLIVKHSKAAQSVKGQLSGKKGLILV